MSDDLVKQLRSMEVFFMDGCISPVAYAAADRIEKLEEALGALWWGVGENGAPDELLEKTKDALKGTKYE